MSKHNQYLEQCFKLAKRGETLAFPNPIVGSVIVHQNKIIGQGFHRQAGQAHAEVNAINDAITNGYQNLFPESTIYVSLEPCSHTGKTPPCADLIIKHRFKCLVFSSYDPNPIVNSSDKIKAAGIEVIEPKDLEPKLVQESNYLNRVFFKTIQEPNSTWITVKIATTADGRMITKPDEPRWITNAESRKDVHRMRSCNDLLITSIRTIEADNPEYTVRHSAKELILATIKNPDVAILKSSTDFSHRNFKIFKEANRKVIEHKVIDLKSTIQNFIDQGYKRIMIEVGPKLSEAFIEAALVDEIVHYQVSPGKALVINHPGFQIYRTEIIASTDIKSCLLKI
ncbi:MAG: bifunctional diaminohydroxyphosphoribosylaminopyrimidine deaminase/5-amino-6-(5-phosphoribosylamino)uracil reductase RibD [Cyanobacteria bacterium]|nr:bifunctional diaminohydroxyphosphoribosylaminopyrimidine deaminase/5-amino-6-(5-phosphoribosylamino)uracil reductase RibD [Cyanobacteriota bacterium]MDA1021673.1 bifunctional diaminohydroxyphosphoribosylaminopyrimidine deaminase/5-amino-6-(5-phosphoribosylamino)uracil reductase RibD [Cyanobacteriota bacterium]